MHGAPRWDGSTARISTLLVAGRSLVVTVRDSAPVAAGEPVELAVWAFADSGHRPDSWNLVANRLAGPPRWGRGEPPRLATYVAKSRREDTTWRAPRHRVVAVGGTTDGDLRSVDVDDVLAASVELGTPHVLLGHGTGAEAVMLAADRSAPAILLDGGIPVATDDTVALRNAWAPSHASLPDDRGRAWRPVPDEGVGAAAGAGAGDGLARRGRL